jgi:Ca-activated chloride channel homolog
MRGKAGLAYEGESWAVIRLTVPCTHAGTGDGSLIELGAVAISYQDLGGNLQRPAPIVISLPSLLPDAFVAVAEDPLVRRRIQELDAANLQDRAQNAARSGHWARVRCLLVEARSNAGDNEWLGAVTNKLEGLAERADAGLFSKEATYASRRMRTRLARAYETPLSADRGPSYVRRKAEQGKARPRR